jgi:predicted Zn-ribbon and HTH transcriptional regulator
MENKCESCGAEYTVWAGKDRGLCPKCLYNQLVIAGILRPDNTIEVKLDDEEPRQLECFPVRPKLESDIRTLKATCAKCRKCYYWDKPAMFVGECPRWSKAKKRARR